MDILSVFIQASHQSRTIRQKGSGLDLMWSACISTLCRSNASKNSMSATNAIACCEVFTNVLIPSRNSNIMISFGAKHESRLGGSPHLSCKRDLDKIRDYMNRRVTSPSWGPHLHVNRSQDIRLIFWKNFRFVSLLTFRVNQLLNIAVRVFFSSRKVEVVKLHLHAIIESKDSFKKALAAFRTFSSKRKSPRCTPRDYSLFII